MALIPMTLTDRELRDQMQRCLEDTEDSEALIESLPDDENLVSNYSYAHVEYHGAAVYALAAGEIDIAQNAFANAADQVLRFVDELDEHGDDADWSYREARMQELMTAVECAYLSGDHELFERVVDEIFSVGAWFYEEYPHKEISYYRTRATAAVLAGRDDAITEIERFAELAEDDIDQYLVQSYRALVNNDADLLTDSLENILDWHESAVRDLTSRKGVVQMGATALYIVGLRKGLSLSLDSPYVPDAADELL